MNYSIYRGSNIVATVVPQGTQNKGVMDLNTVNMTFRLTAAVTFHIGDYVDVYGERYWLFDFAREKKIASNDFQYELEFKGVQYFLFDTNFLFLDSNNNFTRGDFALMGNAATFVDLIISNLNRDSDGITWKRGTVEDTEHRNLIFDGENCLSVLSMLAQEFDTEFWVDPDYTVHLTLREQNAGMTFRYGINEELYDIFREPVQNKIITKLYAEGGEKNIPGDYRNYSPRLLLPAPLAYIEKNRSIFGKKEDYITFDEIYPKRIGTVTSVLNKYTFTDTGIDFDINAQLMPGQKAKIVFNNGQLGGLEFELTYDHAIKQITLMPNTSEKSLETPNDLMKPQVGDQYVIENIIMPQSYITAAENELLAAAQKHIDKYSVAEHRYTVTTNRVTFKSTAMVVNVGDKIRVIDDDLTLNALLRAVSVIRSLQDWFDFNLTLSTLVTVPGIAQIHNTIRKAEKVIQMNDLSNPNLARINWRNQQQIINMVFDTEGNYYTEKISPITIETLAVVVGGRSQALSLVGVRIMPNYNGNPNALFISDGVLNHFSIDPNAVRSWTLSAYTTTFLVSQLNYYIYAKCERAGGLGTWVVTTEQYKYDFDPDYYHFLIGDLFAVYQGWRDFSFVYGQTYINGRTITTGRIQGLSGTFFDLDTGEISGKITFRSGSSGYNNIIDKPDLSGYADASDMQILEGQVNTALNSATTANNKIAEIASDGYLTPNEKQMLMKEVIAIQGERNTIIAMAGTYGVSSVNYVAGYDYLMNYILPYLANLNTTDVIDGPTMRAVFKNYYDTKIVLLKAISDASKSHTDVLRSQLAVHAFEALIEVARLGTTVVQGGYIRTNLLDINAIRITGGLETTSGAQTKADTAQSNAINYAATYDTYYYNTSVNYANSQDVAYYNSSVSYANNRVIQLQNTLGGLAYQSVVEYAMLGTTIIIGGYISTSLLDATWIKANVINVNYIEGLTLNFVRGTIASWYIAASRIYSSAPYSEIELVSGVNPRLAMRSWRNAPVTEAQASGGTGGASFGYMCYSELNPENIFIQSPGRYTPNSGNYVIASFELQPNLSGAAFTRVALELIAIDQTLDYALLCQGRARFDAMLELSGDFYLHGGFNMKMWSGSNWENGYTGVINFIRFNRGIAIAYAG